MYTVASTNLLFYRDGEIEFRDRAGVSQTFSPVVVAANVTNRRRRGSSVGYIFASA